MVERLYCGISEGESIAVSITRVFETTPFSHNITRSNCITGFGLLTVRGPQSPRGPLSAIQHDGKIFPNSFFAPCTIIASFQHLSPDSNRGCQPHAVTFCTIRLRTPISYEGPIRGRRGDRSRKSSQENLKQ